MKNNQVSILALTLLFASLSPIAYGTCGDTQAGSTETLSGGCADKQGYSPGGISKKITWAHVYWRDGYQRTNVEVFATGQSGYSGPFSTTNCIKCWPRFDTPYFEESGTTAVWIQKTYPGSIDMGTNLCFTAATPSSEHRQAHTCSFGGGCGVAPNPVVNGSAEIPTPHLASCCGEFEQLDCLNSGGEFNYSTCSCTSPVIVDVAGNGFNLTNPVNGVPFDINGSGIAQQVSWTAAGSDDAWLTLDRNGNEKIDDGWELFGSVSPQAYLSKGESKNGFRSLALLDKCENGGNDDGQIDVRDEAFSDLRLWRDQNHNGVSEASELRTLPESEIKVIELHYKESKYVDDNGNWFRFRARVKVSRGAHVERWAWDVFLHTTN